MIMEQDKWRKSMWGRNGVNVKHYLIWFEAFQLAFLFDFEMSSSFHLISF